MLLTIHNLPITTRYADVKSLLHEKCGLTDIIVDNLVNEGKSKKVTVGLANEDDGAFVVRKLNGLFINGQQLYIEHKRRNATVQEQPYRPSAKFVQESRGFEQAHINNMVETAMAPSAPSWNQNVTAPYMAHMPADQNVAYSGYDSVPQTPHYGSVSQTPHYGSVPQTPHYIEPRPVPAPNERGYSGFQDNYIPTVTSSGPGHQAPDWGGNGREQPSEAFQYNDRKRRYSPEGLAAPKLSRKDRINAPKQHRQETARVEPPRQRPEQNQGPRQPYREPEQFPRNQHQNVDRYQPREPSPEYRRTDPQWETKRWDEPKAPRPVREREWGDDNRGNWDSQPARGNWDSQPARGNLDSQPARGNWDSQPAKVWDNPPEQQWHEEPRRWDNEPKPQWEENYSSMPVEDNRPEWYDRQEPARPPQESNVQDFHPRGQEQYREPRPSRRSRFDDRNRNVPRPAASSNRQGRPAEETQRQDRPRSKNGRQERQYRDDRPNPSRDRSGGPRKPEFVRQGPKDYPEFKRRPARPEFDQRVKQRHDRDEMYKRKPFGKEEMSYPPRKPEYKPQTLRTLINKDQSNRGQAAALIAKTIVGLPKGKTSYIPDSIPDRFFFKQLKLCIKSRIDVELGEELSSDIGDVVKAYRTKYPINQDKTFLKQMREKAANEYKEIQERKELEGHKEVKNETGLKKEAETENSQKDVLNQATLEVENGIKEDKETAGSDKGTEEVKKPSAVPPVPPNMPKQKPGKPLTDKQKIREMKMQRKWEYDHDDVYSLDEVTNKALDDEMAEIDKLFTDECSKPEGQHEETICKRITTDSLNNFNKTIRLYITKRFLNIQTGLSIRIFSQGKLPSKTAVKEYLSQYRIFNMNLKKSVKGNMFVLNLSRFQDFDMLCRLEQDAIAGVPVNFRALHLTGPPPKITKNQIKAMRERLIHEQIEPNTDLAEFEADNEDIEDFGDIEDSEEKEEIVENTDDVAGDFEGEDLAADMDVAEGFGEDINIGNINEEDLEDF